MEIENLRGEPMKTDLSVYLGKIDEAYLRCTPGELDGTLRAIVQDALSEYGRDDLRRAVILNELGGHYRHIRRIPEAEAAFLEAIEIQQTVAGESDPDYATSLNNLAGLYRISGECDKSEKLFMKAAQIYKDCLSEDHYLYTSSLNNLALLYQDMSFYEKAASLHLEAAEILKTKEDPESQIGYATSLSNLAAAFMKMKKYDDSEKFLNAALNIYGRIVGKEHTLYAAALNNLGSIYYETGDPQRSREAYAEAFEICKRKLGLSHPETLKARENLIQLEQRLQ